MTQENNAIVAQGAEVNSDWVTELLPAGTQLSFGAASGCVSILAVGGETLLSLACYRPRGMRFDKVGKSLLYCLVVDLCLYNRWLTLDTLRLTGESLSGITTNYLIEITMEKLLQRISSCC
mmetsp:Transcript_6652/g.14839  ORF Transcript_6652/g.14839 Transcript_6652/m.14839 type:complete len:121 (+) Transcript_6652:343-705(+)